MAWKTTADAPPAAWPWRTELLNPDWVPDPCPPDEQAACRFIARRVALQGKHVLDFGCGRGACLGEAVVLGAGLVSAVDLDNDALELTQKLMDRFARVLHFKAIPDEFGYVDLPDKCADIVWSHGVVEHLTDNRLAIYLREARRLAREYVAVSAPNPANGPYQAFRKYLLDNEKWIYGYEEPLPSYGPAMEAAGLRVVCAEQLGASSEDLALLYAKPLPRSDREYWTDRFLQGASMVDPPLQGPVTVTIGIVPK